MAMNFTLLPDFSTAPSRSDPGTFSARADVLMGELPPFVTSFNAILTLMNNGLVTTTLQSSTTDNTAGRALMVGGFGIGGTGVTAPNGNLDDVVASGIYNVGTNTTGTPATTGPTGSACQTMVFNSDTQVQVFYERDSTAGYVVYRREKRSGSWAAWTRTSSLSGSNANGYFERFECGHQICTFLQTGATTTAASGNVFRDSSTFGAWTFPAAFISEPACYFNPQGTSVWGSCPSASATSLSARTVWSPSALTSVSIETSTVAIGRWF